MIIDVCIYQYFVFKFEEITKISKMISPLTSLRFFFALMVFFSHLDFLKESKYPILQWIYNNIFQEGYMGVSFFFILSGFILSYNYQEGILTKKLSLRKYFIARFARIYPLHILTFIIALPLSYKLFTSDFISGIIKVLFNVSLTQSFIPFQSVYFSFNAPSWSISDEMFFYVMFPVLVFVFFQSKRVYSLLFIIAFIPLLSLMLNNEYNHWIYYINPMSRLIDFIIGMLLFEVYKVLNKKQYLDKISFTFLEIVVVIVLGIFVFFHQYISQVARFSFYYWIPMSSIILVFSYQKGKLSKILSLKPLIYLGEISFGFYLFHQLIIRYYLAISDKKIISINDDFLVLIILFLITLFVSYISYERFEKPMNKVVKDKMSFKK